MSFTTTSFEYTTVVKAMLSSPFNPAQSGVVGAGVGTFGAGLVSTAGTSSAGLAGASAENSIRSPTFTVSPVMRAMT